MNIKSLPAQYILKRWTREARSGTVQDNQGRNIIENPKLDDMLRYENMTRKFLNMAHRAASHPKCTLLVNNTLTCLASKSKKKSMVFLVPGILSLFPQMLLPIDLVSIASLKKKEVETKTQSAKEIGLTRSIG
jgi:zinc finger SWIM domain-containing protein 3